VSSLIRVRTIDPRGQRFGAGLSATSLIAGILLDQPIVAVVVGSSLAISAAFGTQWFLFGRPWPAIRQRIRLGAPPSVEPELGPRFAQAFGALFILLGLVLLAGGVRPWFWLPIAAVAGLQVLLAVTGYCLGCRLYGLHWFLPELFDRVVLRLPVESRIDLGRPRAS